MDVVLRGRGIDVTDHLRRAVEHKLTRMSRRPRPEVLRLEVEVIAEGSPRVDGGHRVHMTCHTARRDFRSEGSGSTVDAALEQALERLDRQISTYRGKRESRLTGRANRIQSRGSRPDEPGDPA